MADSEVRQKFEAWEIALAEYAELREEIGRLEEMGDCSCDANEFHTCSLCIETAAIDQRARALMNLWGDTWAMRLFAARKCPECKGERVVMTAAAGAGHADDLAEYCPCPNCEGTGMLKNGGNYRG